jgi:hypothetical protein
MTYKLTYLNKGVRDKPLSDEVLRAYEQAALAAKIDEIRVMSGGQDSSGPNRTGSHRHDDGGAGDVQLVRGGRVLEFTNPEDLPYIKDWVSAGKGAGLTGYGAGSDYMGDRTIHAGGGSPVVWGRGGSSANAPEWLRQAYGTTLASNPVTATASASPALDPTASTEFPAAPPAPESKMDGALGALGDLATALKGKPGNPDDAKIAPASISGQQGPGTVNPQAAQSMLAQLLQPKNNSRGIMAMLGMT